MSRTTGYGYVDWAGFGAVGGACCAARTAIALRIQPDKTVACVRAVIDEPLVYGDSTRPLREDDNGLDVRGYLTFSSSTSKTSVALGGMTLPAPLVP